MLNFLLFVAAACATILETHGAATATFDLNAILDIIRTQQRIANTDNNNAVSKSSSAESLENQASLRSRELIRLLHRTLEDAKKRKLTEGQSKYNCKSCMQNDLANNKEDDDRYEDNKNLFSVEGFLKNLLKQSNKNKYEPSGKEKRKLKPSALLDPYEEDKKDDANGLTDYSKIYVILNPKTLRSSQNKEKLTDLISLLMANSSPDSQRVDQGLNEVRHKSNSAQGSLSQRRSRRRRDSMEASMENRQKRLRSYNHGGGGGGSHTAIPYIRQRGDIYVQEQD